ncbi:MAG: hypothetical protein HYR91_04975 [Flavobacteriia bacterium]|nr:hypothetical protein [Flavobacteriia bacterium]
MKRKIIIGLIFVYLFTSTEFSEVFKIPFLFDHFTEHQSENKNITFGQFLFIHYVNHNHDSNSQRGNEDHDNESQLPFHSHTDYSIAFNYFFPTPAIKFVLEPFVAENNTGKIFFDNQSLRSYYTPSIWQPPKLV